MPVFVLLCVLMVLAAVALLAWPLLRPDAAQAGTGDEIAMRDIRQNRAALALVSLLVALLSALLYARGSNWPWVTAETTPAASGAAAALQSLAEQANANPDNLELQLQWAKALVSAMSYGQAVEVFERAYTLSHGQNLDVITGWAEALVLADPSSVNGRASLLVEEALKLEPTHPRALWYGGLIALQMQNLPLARDRFKTMLTLNPPDSVRKLLERQVQDLDDQIGGAAGGAMAQASATPERRITVQVTLADAVKTQLKQPISLFVLARDPQQPGAPLAVERHSSNELPLIVELSAADAMLPTRTLKDAQTVEIVARLSASGTPAAQSGDWYGSATHSFGKQGEQASVAIEISQKTP